MKLDKNHLMQLFPALFCGSKNNHRPKANPDTHKWHYWLIKATSESSLHMYILHYINSKLQLYMDWWKVINKTNSSIPVQNCIFKTNCSHQGLSHRKSLCTGENIVVLKKNGNLTSYSASFITECNANEKHISECVAFFPYSYGIHHLSVSHTNLAQV